MMQILSQFGTTIVNPVGVRMLDDGYRSPDQKLMIYRDRLRRCMMAVKFVCIDKQYSMKSRKWLKRRDKSFRKRVHKRTAEYRKLIKRIDDFFDTKLKGK